MRCLVVEDDDELRGLPGPRPARGGLRRRRRRRPAPSCCGGSPTTRRTRWSSTSGCPTPTAATSARRCGPAACTSPVLFLTARDAPARPGRGFHAGGDDYLTKPFALAEVVRAPARPPAPRRRPGQQRRCPVPRARPGGPRRHPAASQRAAHADRVPAAGGARCRGPARPSAAGAGGGRLAARRPRPREHPRRVRRAPSPQAPRGRGPGAIETARGVGYAMR